MHKQLRRRAVFATLLLTVLASLAQGEPSRAPSNPATGFSSKANITSAASTDLSGVVPLKQHGNGNGGQDYGYHNVGVVFGAKVYSGNFAVAMELYYYIPSQPDYLYREGDYRGSTGRIGNNTGSDGGEYYCPEGYAAVGLQGSSGLAIDRVGLVCGKIGDFSRLVSMPIFGGNGGNAFYDNCVGVQSSGFMTGVRVRSSSWMDSIQALCQAGGPISMAAPAPALPAPAVPKSAAKLADERAADVVVGTSRSEVLQKLGEPFSKISGDSERFTYQLESGGTIRLVIEDGRVTQIQNGHH